MQLDPLIEVLIARRKALNLSREKMANIAGMSTKTYQRIERGESDLKLSQYRSILRALNLTDIDIALDIKGVSNVVAEDIVAASRLLPPEAQYLLVRLIFMTFKDPSSNQR
ncbi:helix-turn-helix transcriptional regulator [Vibrio sagamiensis]|uniref:Transcriptional regulator n=1 Tax=Vibrio sagamiensis NBRC 104589 TaxID=1219064 RepID=A0A511QHF7_9VIBR|nr:helix-turn-helix transcriptional regulator [Vibrio sagamiensis]PNQ54897.1 XRE family transcriptional regulator [Vibrio agarivorans]GEM76576.1 transcriptional regulator [Vibrio sagamiensis NBRC 104589]